MLDLELQLVSEVLHGGGLGPVADGLQHLVSLVEGVDRGEGVQELLIHNLLHVAVKLFDGIYV